jgi:hypothetical protein
VENAGTPGCEAASTVSADNISRSSHLRDLEWTARVGHGWLGYVNFKNSKTHTKIKRTILQGSY